MQRWSKESEDGVGVATPLGWRRNDHGIEVATCSTRHLGPTVSGLPVPGILELGEKTAELCLTIPQCRAFGESLSREYAEPVQYLHQFGPNPGLDG